MYFISNTCPKIIITDNIETINVNDYFDTKIRDTLNQDEFEINEEQFHIYHIRMEENVSKHELHLCASDREVESLDLSKKIPNLNTKLVDSNGNSYFYIGYITGNYLDENVNSNRTSFNIIEEHNGINKVTRNDLFETARKYIELYLQEDIKTIVDKKKERVNAYIETKKPQYKFLINAKPEVLDEIPNGLDDEAIELELHKQSQKWEIVELTIKIGKKELKQNIPFYIELVIGSAFTWNDVFDENTLQILLSQNAPALLLSYARPIIHSLTSMTPFPAYNVPFYNFTEK